jgi:hypothetical protein
MDFMVNIDLKKPPKQINYEDKILLIGSCFTEHIGNSLEELKFSVLQNPNGILFDPLSVTQSIASYVQNKQYNEKDFFQLNEVWHSWRHHSRFSNTDLREAVRIVNESQQRAHQFLTKADWIIITLGSSFSYRLTKLAESSVSPVGRDLPTAPSLKLQRSKVEQAGLERSGGGVANCHRAPAQWFHKYLMTIDDIVSGFDNCLGQLLQFNSNVNIIFTVSPVRHIRDGVVDNNRSKARLIEAVHHLVSKYEKLYYFPAYELVIDVLRDYRFYDADLVHPNYMATEFVLERFADTFIDESTQSLMKEVKSIMIARRHKAFQPDTMAHKQFLKAYFDKTKALMDQYSFLNLKEEIEYFNS